MAAVALVLAPTAIAQNESYETVDPDCRELTDSAGIECTLPDRCQSEDDSPVCDTPPGCERIDEMTFRCVPDTQPDDETTQTQTYENETTQGSEDTDDGTHDDAPGCEPAPDQEGVICTQPDECESNTSDRCQVPPECEPRDDDTYLCTPPDDEQREHSEPAGEGPACEPAPDQPDAMVCTPPEECRNADPNQTECQPPPECEPRGDGTYLCTAPEGGETRTDSARASAEVEPKCTSNGDGTIVCQPPAECEGKIGETEACTPPETCSRRSDGAFVCTIPDRAPHGMAGAEDRRASEENGSDVAKAPGEDDHAPFSESSEQAREEARQAIARSLSDSAETFKEKLGSLKASYQEEKNALKDRYEEGKDELRDEYRDCRSSIAANVSGQARTAEMRACLEDARQGLTELRSEVQADHAQLKDEMKQKAEQAREQACQSAEQAALDAIAEHGVFDANPADLMPDRTLELCPSFSDFSNGGTGQ